MKAVSAIPCLEERRPGLAIGGAVQVDIFKGLQMHVGRLWDGSFSPQCNPPAAPQAGFAGLGVMEHPSDPLTIPVSFQSARANGAC